MKNILQCQDGAAKITALSWSPNNLKLAVCTADRVISLFDDTGERKPSEKPFKMCLEALNLDPEETIMVEIGRNETL